MATKVVRIPLLVASEKYDYISVYKMLWKLQDEVRNVKNKTIQLLWEWSNYSHIYNKENGIYPKASDVLPLKTFSGNINALLKNEFCTSYSCNLSTYIRNAEKDYKNSISEVLKGNRSIIEYKGNCPIELHNKSMTFIMESDNIFCKINLFSSAYSKQLELPDTTLTFKLQIPGSFKALFIAL